MKKKYTIHVDSSLDENSISYISNQFPTHHLVTLEEQSYLSKCHQFNLGRNQEGYIHYKLIVRNNTISLFHSNIPLNELKFEKADLKDIQYLAFYSKEEEITIHNLNIQ